MMNRFVLTSIAAAVMAIGTSGATAQSPSTTGTGSSSSMTPSTPATRNDAMPGSAGMSGKTMTNNYSGMRDSQAWERTHRVSKIIGMDVVNSKGEKVGDVEDIVLDGKGNIAYAVVSTGGFLGMGEKMHAVPWSSLRTSTGSDNYMLDVDRERLRTAPGFDQGNWPNVNDAKWSSENRRYFPESGTTRSTTPSKTSANQMNSGQPLTTPTGSKDTPAVRAIEGGQPATGGTSSVNRPTAATQGADAPAVRAIEGETRRGAEANKPTPAEATGSARSGGGSPPADSPVAKTNPSGGSK